MPAELHNTLAVLSGIANLAVIITLLVWAKRTKGTK